MNRESVARKGVQQTEQVGERLMGKWEVPAKLPDVDFYGTPEYFVTKTWFEPTGSSCVRLYAVCEKNGQVFPLYTAVMEATDAIAAGSEAVATGETVFNHQQMIGRRQSN